MEDLLWSAGTKLGISAIKAFTGSKAKGAGKALNVLAGAFDEDGGDDGDDDDGGDEDYGGEEEEEAYEKEEEEAVAEEAEEEYAAEEEEYAAEEVAEELAEEEYYEEEYAQDDYAQDEYGYEDGGEYDDSTDATATFEQTTGTTYEGYAYTEPADDGTQDTAYAQTNARVRPRATSRGIGLAAAAVGGAAVAAGAAALAAKRGRRKPRGAAMCPPGRGRGRGGAAPARGGRPNQAVGGLPPGRGGTLRGRGRGRGSGRGRGRGRGGAVAGHPVAHPQQQPGAHSPYQLPPQDQIPLGLPSALGPMPTVQPVVQPVSYAAVGRLPLHSSSYISPPPVQQEAQPPPYATVAYSSMPTQRQQASPAVLEQIAKRRLSALQQVQQRERDRIAARKREEQEDRLRASGQPGQLATQNTPELEPSTKINLPPGVASQKVGRTKSSMAPQAVEKLKVVEKPKTTIQMPNAVEMPQPANPTPRPPPVNPAPIVADNYYEMDGGAIPSAPVSYNPAPPPPQWGAPAPAVELDSSQYQSRPQAPSHANTWAQPEQRAELPPSSGPQRSMSMVQRFPSRKAVPRPVSMAVPPSAVNAYNQNPAFHQPQSQLVEAPQSPQDPQEVEGWTPPPPKSVPRRKFGSGPPEISAISNSGSSRTETSVPDSRPNETTSPVRFTNPAFSPPPAPPFPPSESVYARKPSYHENYVPEAAPGRVNHPPLPAPPMPPPSMFSNASPTAPQNANAAPHYSNPNLQNQSAGHHATTMNQVDGHHATTMNQADGHYATTMNQADERHRWQTSETSTPTAASFTYNLPTRRPSHTQSLPASAVSPYSNTAHTYPTSAVEMPASTGWQSNVTTRSPYDMDPLIAELPETAGERRMVDNTANDLNRSELGGSSGGATQSSSGMSANHVSFGWESYY
ncbi:hypothetical protein TWF696_004664 [Orbilia brochopaga]|uniref:Uncharacterized protein n=1 Tax=Orbilia brochopaga TaxID=3140254 RepID=A0AAV9V7Z4_9PEZI